jgi:hypothetical protein
MKLIRIGIFLVIAGCSHKTRQQSFVDFINNPENKITQKIKVGNVTAILKWQPPEYLKMMDSTTVKTDSSSNQFYYFDAKFEKPGNDKLSKEKIMYLDFDIEKDFTLINGRDSIPASICQRIQNGQADNYEYLLAFEKRDNNDFTVAYNDKIFGIGTVAFVYRQADIQKLPMLKTAVFK